MCRRTLIRRLSAVGRIFEHPEPADNACTDGHLFSAWQRGVWPDRFRTHRRLRLARRLHTGSCAAPTGSSPLSSLAFRAAWPPLCKPKAFVAEAGEQVSDVARAINREKPPHSHTQ